jgi:hypothetical protein
MRSASLHGAADVRPDWDGVDVAIRWTVITVVLAFVAACAVLLLTPWTEARADEPPLTEQMQTYLYGVAYGQCPQLRGMAKGCPPEWLKLRPPVYLVSQQVICGTAQTRPDCPYKGFYRNGAVYLRADLNFGSAVDLSVLVHEYVHHLQELKNGPFKDCEDWLEREYEAYGIQRYVLIQDRQGFAAEKVQGEARQLRCGRPQ